VTVPESSVKKDPGSNVTFDTYTLPAAIMDSGVWNAVTGSTRSPIVTISTRNIPDRDMAQRIGGTFPVPERTGLVFTFNSRHAGIAFGFTLLNMDFLSLRAKI
jgi:hypothetical protein